MNELELIEAVRGKENSENIKFIFEKEDYAKAEHIEYIDRNCGCKQKTQIKELIRTRRKIIQCVKCNPNRSVSIESYLKRFYSIKDNHSLNVEEYTRIAESLRLSCKVCGTVFSYSTAEIPIKRGGKCPTCHKNANTRRVTQEDFIKRLAAKNIKPLEQYKNNKTKTLVQCNICSHSWSVVPNTLFLGWGCPSCSQNKPVDLIEFKKRLNKDFCFDDETEKYGYTDYCRVKHLECNQSFMVRPKSFLRNQKCRVCYQKSLTAGELAIYKLLNRWGVDFEMQFIFEDLISPKGKPLRFDFAVKIHNRLGLIEFDGEQHFKPVSFSSELTDDDFKYRIELDQQKNRYCETRKIPLLRIPYFLSAEDRELELREFVNSLTFNDYPERE